MPTKITLKDHQEKLKIKKRISFSTSPTPSYSKPLITYSSSSSLFCYWLLERRWIFSPFSIFLHSEWPMHESGIGGVVRAKRVSIGLVETGLRSIYWRLFGPCSIFVMQIIVYLHPLVCWRRIYILFSHFYSYCFTNPYHPHRSIESMATFIQANVLGTSYETTDR